MMKLWNEAFPEKTLDKDSPEHMNWIYEQAAARATRFGIGGVTYNLTLGVTKNIIPAIASTNAIVAAACTAEALKLVTYCGQTMHNYFVYQGAEGVNCNTFAYERTLRAPLWSVRSLAIMLLRRVYYSGFGVCR
jgi:ubiquitin-activating enzyme E1 C